MSAAAATAVQNFSPAQSYRRGDIVAYEGKQYVCCQAGFSPSPAEARTVWDLLVIADPPVVRTAPPLPSLPDGKRDREREQPSTKIKFTADITQQFAGMISMLRVGHIDNTREDESLAELVKASCLCLLRIRRLPAEELAVLEQHLVTASSQLKYVTDKSVADYVDTLLDPFDLTSVPEFPKWKSVIERFILSHKDILHRYLRVVLLLFIA